MIRFANTPPRLQSFLGIVINDQRGSMMLQEIYLLIL
jgi:hypothetical protein